jgi:hypothetical protein
MSRSQVALGVELVRDVLNRIVRAREALYDGEGCCLESMLDDLEHDLASWLGQVEEGPAT